MKRKITRGAVAALAAALALGPFLASPASADLQSFQARSESHALRIVVDLSGLPTDLVGVLNTAWADVPDAAKTAAGFDPAKGFPLVIDQYLIRTSSDATSSMTKALSVLGTVGETPNAYGLNLGSVSADSVGQSNSSSTQGFTIPGTIQAPVEQIPSLGLDVVNGTLGKLSASVASGPKVVGDASLASVTASLADIAAMAPELSMVFETVNVAVATAVATANQTLEDAKDELFAAAGPALEGTPVEGVLADADDLVGEISLPLEVPNPFTQNVQLAEITDILANTTSEKSVDLSAATSTSSIKAVDVLDGFLKAGLINLSAHSEAGGKAGTAKNAAACTIADLRIGGDSGIALDGQNVYVDGQPVPVPAAEVAGLKNQVDDVLAQAGISVELCDSSRATTAADGSSATQQVSAFIATIEPRVPAGADLSGTPLDGLVAGDSLGVRIIVDPTVSTAVGATPAALAAPAQLPKTGAPAVATMLSGAALAAGALALRRRVR